MTGEPRRAVALAILCALAAIAGLAIVESPTPFPPGGDPGHLLALSHAITGEPTEGPLAYAPGLPAIFALLRIAIGDDPRALLVAIKALGLALFLAQAAGVAALAGALAPSGAERRAAAWGFGVACANPLAWFQILWGGYPQFLAVALACFALALLSRALRAERPFANAALAGALFAGVAAVHTYTTLFTAPAALALLLASARRSRAWRAPLAAGATAGGVAAALAVPLLPTYFRIATGVRGGGAESSYSGAFTEIGRSLSARWEIALVAGLLLLVAFVSARRSPWPLHARELAIAFAAGLATLLVATPPLLVARLADFLAVGAIAAAAARLAALAREQRDPRRAAVVLVAGLLALTAVDAAATHPRFAALDENDLDAMRAVADLPPGRVLVASPWPNADGWWLEGIAGRPALVGDLLKWYALDSEAERSVAARTLVAGLSLLDGGALRVVDASPATTHGAPALWVRDESEYYPLVEHDAALAFAIVEQGFRETAWGPAGHRNVTVEQDAGNGVLVTRGDSGPVRVERETRGTAEGVRLAWTFSVATGTVGELDLARVALVAPPGVVFHAAQREGDRAWIDAEFVWEGLHRRIEVRVDAPADWRFSFAPVGPYGAAVVTFAFEGTGLRALAFALDLAVAGIEPEPWKLVEERDLLAEWDVRYAYVRGPLASDRERFDGDPAFERVWSRGDVTLYRVVNA